MSDQVFCKDCRYIEIKDGKFSSARCKHPSSLTITPEKINLVSGEKEQEERRYYYCDTNRIFDCGPAGKLFEPADEKERRLYLTEKRLDKEEIMPQIPHAA